MTEQRDGTRTPCEPRIAAFFDLDKTVIAKSSMLAFSGPLRSEGLINRKAMLRSAYANLLFMLGGAEAEQVERMREYLTALCTGWDVQQVRAIVEEALHDVVDPLVYTEATELITQHKESGHDVVVISASGEELVAPIARMLGATYSVATRMVVEEGRYTGAIEFYCYGEQKAVAVEDLATRNGYTLSGCYAYSDSMTDLPMLEAVGNPCAVNPNRALRKVALEREWPVRVFDAAVPLRERLQGGGAAMAVGIGAVAAGVTWYELRRRKK